MLVISLIRETGVSSLDVVYLVRYHRTIHKSEYTVCLLLEATTIVLPGDGSSKIYTPVLEGTQQMG